MVDPTRIKGLAGISREDGHIVIGCGATHTMIMQNEEIIRYGTCLAESCGVIGGPQVRNVATLAGNIAHAMPAGDGTIGLLALDGEVETADDTGRHWTSLADVFLGPGLSAIDPYCTLLTRLRFKPTETLCGSAFHRVMRPQGVALPMIAMAACLQLDGQHDIVAARISIGPAGPIPHLAVKAMEFLVTGPATKDRFEQATEIALGKLTLRDSKYRASKPYREEMIRTQLPRVLALAAERAVKGYGESAR
jgi:carbon-monoxide dehydrogenase medium subunit